MTDKNQHTTAQNIVELYGTGDREWAEQFHAAMILADANEAQSRSELQRNLRIISDSGQNAADIFGDGWLYGKQRAQEIKNPSQLASEDLPAETVTGFIGGFVVVLGLLMLGFGTWIAFRDGWLNQSWMYWQLASLSFAGGVVITGAGTWYLRRATRMGEAWTMFGLGAIATLAVGIPLVTMFDEEAISPLPNFTGPAAGIAAIVIGWFMIGASSQDKNMSTPHTTEQWFEQATKILHSRFGLKASESQPFMEQTRQHFSDEAADTPDANISDSFGTPTEWATAIATQTPQAVRRRLVRSTLLQGLVIASYGAVQISVLFTDGISAMPIIWICIALILIIFSLLQLRPKALNARTETRMARLKRAAELVEEARNND